MEYRGFPEARHDLDRCNRREVDLIAKGINPYNEDEAGKNYIPESLEDERLENKNRWNDLVSKSVISKRGKFDLDKFGRLTRGMRSEGPYSVGDVNEMRSVIKQCGYNHLRGSKGARVSIEGANSERIVKVFEDRVRAYRKSKR